MIEIKFYAKGPFKNLWDSLKFYIKVGATEGLL
jgi:hypothetical protein